jgi:hypothetical protein
MDEMNITPFSSSRPQRLFEAAAWSESTIGLLQRNNIFNVTTLNSTHSTLRYYTHHPPHPHLYTITMFIVHDKTEGSWKLRGTPSLDPIYIYMYVYLCVFTWLIIYRYISIVISELIRYGNVQILARKWKCLWKFRRRSAIFG